MAFSRVLLLLTILTGASRASAQPDSGSVRLFGTVRDIFGQPISGAEVRVPGTPASAFTSDSGTFHLRVERKSPILLQVRRPGYRAELLKTDGDWNGTVVLQQGTYELPDIQVTARYAKPAAYASTHKYDGFFQRQRMGFGQFITREEIDRRFAQSTAQLLEGRAGIRVDYRRGEEASGSVGTIIAFARCNEYPPKINVYLDGHKVISRVSLGEPGGDLGLRLMQGGISNAELAHRREVRASVGEMLDRVHPAGIELMEIYRGPSELPAEFNDGNCGAIVIWTREGGR